MILVVNEAKILHISAELREQLAVAKRTTKRKKKTKLRAALRE
jgi:hypothetical protein